MLVSLLIHQRQDRIVFSDGSWLVVRTVTFGKRHFYYHQPFRRTIAALISETAWTRFAQQFPGFISWCGIDESKSGGQTGSDSLGVIGYVKIQHIENRLWEFTAVDRKGNESNPMPTPMLDRYGAFRGPGMLALAENVPTNWPIVLHIYERNPMNGQRVLMAKLPAKITK
jgi:hypothetical protein